MLKTTVLFVCPCNSLLGPLAECYLNARAGSFVRAFSAGAIPADSLSPYVPKLLFAGGLSAEGLAPKPVDVFLLPHAPVPDRVIYLAHMPPVSMPTAWKATTSSHCWSVARDLPVKQDLASGARYFGRIRQAVDSLVGCTLPAATAA